MTWLLNLGFAGGETAAEWNANTFYIPAEDNTLFIRRGVHEVKRVYLDRDSDAQIQLFDWSAWLDSGESIASYTLEVDETASSSDGSALTTSNSSNTSTVVTTYLDTDAYGYSKHLKNQIVTDADIPRTAARSIIVKTVRT